MTLRIVVMGVAGSGKSSLAAPLAASLGARLVEADDLHPPANIAKMSEGIPLTDDDRRPWLDLVAEELTRAPVVATCSALRRAYRDRLRRPGNVRFVHLETDEATALDRLERRHDHFMGPEMVRSQFAALEAPADDEHDIVVLDATAAVEANVASALRALHPDVG